MAKPEKVRITLDDKNEIEMVEVLLGGNWVQTKPSECCDTGAREGDRVIRIGAIAEPNSCTQDPRCPAPSNLCTLYIDGCLQYSC